MPNDLVQVKGGTESLKRTFGLLALFLKCGDNAKVFRLRSFNGKTYMLSQTFMTFRAYIGESSGDVDISLMFEDISAMIDGEEFMLEVYPDGVTITTDNGECRLGFSHADIFFTETPEVEMRLLTNPKEFIAGLVLLDKLTEYKNQYKTEAKIQLYNNLMMSIYKTALFYVKVPNEHLDQIIDINVGKMLRSFVTKTTFLGESREYQVLKDGNVEIVMSRITVPYNDPEKFETPAVKIAVWDSIPLTLGLKAMLALYKQAVLNVLVSSEQSSVTFGISTPNAEMKRTFSCETETGGGEHNFVIPLNFLFSALSIFKGQVGVHLCRYENTQILILRNESVKCFLSLIG